MSAHITISGDTIVDELMTAHRETIAVFLRHRMMCVGCPVAGLHDLREACGEHGVALEEFLADVRAAIAAA